MSKPIESFTPDALDVLVKYNWPGNIRELENAVERAMVVGKPPFVKPEDLPFQLGETKKVPMAESLAEIEKNHIIFMLGKTGWNITRSAEALGIDRVTLYNKIEKYGLRK